MTTPTGSGDPEPTVAMRRGRQADSLRRRQRVLAAINKAVLSGGDTSVAGIARTADVNRAFLYRHRDLLEKLHAAQTAPAPTGDGGTGPGVTRASLQADLLAAHERAARLNTRVHQLEKNLSQALGQRAWQQSGLGAPADIDALNTKIAQLQQQVIDLQLQLAERDEDLAASRATNRELMAQLNTTR